jgi:hypothetical protein
MNRIPFSSDKTGGSDSVLISNRTRSSYRRHPERSRFSGGAKDLRYDAACRGRSLGPLVKARTFGMTPETEIQTKLLANQTLIALQDRKT